VHADASGESDVDGGGGVVEALASQGGELAGQGSDGWGVAQGDGYSAQALGAVDPDGVDPVDQDVCGLGVV